MDNPYNGPSAIMVKVKLNTCSGDDHAWAKHIKLCAKSWSHDSHLTVNRLQAGHPGQIGRIGQLGRKD